MTTTYVTKQARRNDERRKALITGGEYRNDDDAKHGFKHAGEFAKAVAYAGAPEASPNAVDARLFKGVEGKSGPTTLATGGVGQDGGFAIPPTFVAEIMRTVAGEDSILGMTDQLPIEGRGAEIPFDSIEPWNNARGIRCFWQGEGQKMTESKPELHTRNYKLSSVTALVPVSDDLLEDSLALAAWMPSKAADKLEFEVGDAIFRGDGIGKPLGFMKSDAYIINNKESGQAADTIVAENLAGLMCRIYSRYRSDLVFFYHPSAEAELLMLKSEGADGGVFPVMLPPGGLSRSPYTTILGRPAIATEHCETLGNPGDVVAASLGQYQTVIKSSGMQYADSMHLWFDHNVTAFRFKLRVDGHPKLPGPIQPRTGNHELTAFAGIQVRA